MFLKALQVRNRAFLEAAVALHQAGRVPAGAYLLDLDTMTENARTMSAEAGRLGLDVLAMTKQIGRNPARARCAQGGRDRPLRRRRHGLCPADPREWPRARPHWPSLPDPASRGGGGRGHAPGLLDHLQRGEGNRGRACGARPRPRAGADCPHPGARRYLLFRPRRGLRRGRRRGRGGSARPHAGRALRRAYHLPCPALRRGRRRGEADAQSRHPARGSIAACAARPAGHRHQRAGHHVRACDGGAGRRWCNPGGAGPRAHRHDAAATPARSCRSARRCST